MKVLAIFLVAYTVVMAEPVYAGQNGTPAQQGEGVAKKSFDPSLPAGGVILRVPDDRRDEFYKVVLQFASEHFFEHTQGQRDLRLTDHFFGWDTFARPDGIWFFVTDITRRGKMQIAFYGNKSETSFQQAAKIADEFESQISEYERYAK